ncbi:MAG: sensor histidine kinase [Wujia sp.]
MDKQKKEKNKEQQNPMKLSRISAIATFIAAAVVIIIIILLGTTDNMEVLHNRDASDFEKVDKYTCVEIGDEGAPIGIKKEYTFILEGTPADDSCLAFYTVHQYVEVYLEGENVYSLKPSGEKTFCKTVGSNWIMIPLYREDAGKEVRVEITPVYESFRNREVDFLVGSELAIYKNRLSKDLPQLVLGVMAIFVGLVFVFVAGYSQIRRQNGKGLVALGIFSVMLGIWRLTDTRFTPFIFPNHSVLLFYLSVMMLMLGMIPMMKWLEEYFTEKSQRIIDFYCVISAINCLIQLACQLAGISELRDTLYITHIVIAIGVVIAIGTAIYERVKYPDKSPNRIVNKLPYLCVAGVVADVVAFYVKGNSSGLLFSLLAFILYIVIMGTATLFNYSEQEILLAEKDRELAEKERKLTERRVASMMSQIRSHFIFNVLTTISGYCKIDPKKADNALICFSRYLRKNISIIEEEGLIDFDMELEQLEDYVSLEQLRFQDMIVFEKDIETRSFLIPPLTIQPIVENAIKHGLVGHNRSGVIRLSVVRKAECIEITVSDNGVGFVPEECDESNSVGIRNVRYRLENMVGGRLDIRSSPEEGTNVTIIIPVS